MTTLDELLRQHRQLTTVHVERWVARGLLHLRELGRRLLAGLLELGKAFDGLRLARKLLNFFCQRSKLGGCRVCAFTQVLKVTLQFGNFFGTIGLGLNRQPDSHIGCHIHSPHNYIYPMAHTKKQPTVYGAVMTALACIALAAPGWGLVGLSLLAIAAMFVATAVWIAWPLLA